MFLLHIEQAEQAYLGGARPALVLLPRRPGGGGSKGRGGGTQPGTCRRVSRGGTLPRSAAASGGSLSKCARHKPHSPWKACGWEVGAAACWRMAVGATMCGMDGWACSLGAIEPLVQVLMSPCSNHRTGLARKGRGSSALGATRLCAVRRGYACKAARCVGVRRSSRVEQARSTRCPAARGRSDSTTWMPLPARLAVIGCNPPLSWPGTLLRGCARTERMIPPSTP